MSEFIRRGREYLYDYCENTDRKKLIILLIIFVCICSSWVLLIPGIPTGHDLTFHLSRISAIRDGLLLGEFPVKIYPNYFDGYGYANGLFYPDIFLYLPAVLCIFGFKVITSYKIFLFICTVCTALSMYYCVKDIFKSNYMASLSMILYTLSSYRISNMYTRAALGEVLAFIFVPIVVLGIYKIIYEDYKKWYVLTIGFAGLFLSHFISTLLMVGFTAVILILTFKRLYKEPKRIVYLLLATVVTISLVAFFMFPMLEQLLTEKFIVNTETTLSNVWNTTLPIYKVVFAIPYSLLSLKGVTGIGTVFILIIYLRFRTKIPKESKFVFVDKFIILGCLAIIAVTKIFPWKLILKFVRQLSVIQFSWRLFLFVTLFLSLSGGVVVYFYAKTNKKKINMFIIVSMLSILSCSTNMFAQYLFYGYTYYKGLYNISIEPYKIGFGEYLPEGTDKAMLFDRGDVITSNNDINYNFSREGTTLKIKFSNNNYNNTYLDLPLLYYKGYEANYKNNDDNTVLPISKGDNNIIRVKLDKYIDGEIIVRYNGTLIQRLSGIVSALSLIIFIIYMMKIKILNKKRRKYENEKIIYNNTNV